MKTKFTGFRCPQELLEKAKKEAAQDQRSLSSFINKAIADAIRRVEQSHESDREEFRHAA